MFCLVNWLPVAHILQFSDLFVLLQLGVVDLADLGEFGSVIWVFGRVIGSDSSRCRCRCRSRRRPAPFLRPGHALRQQHVVQSHQLGIGRLLLLGATDTQHWNETKTERLFKQLDIPGCTVWRQRLWIYWVWHEGSGLIDPQRIHSFWWIVFEAETKKMGKAAVDFAKFYDDIIKLHLIHIMSFPLSAAALWL